VGIFVPLRPNARSGITYNRYAIRQRERWPIMKAAVVHKYGGPEELKYEDFADPAPASGEVLVRVAAASVNPWDFKQRSGATKAFAPLEFPSVIGADFSGTVVKVGAGVTGFAAGDKVFGQALHTYAELCAAPAANLAKLPAGLDLVEAAALPVVTTTGSQLITLGTGVDSNAQAGQRILVTGAAGSVGRSAVFTAKQRRAFVIAGVRKSQLQIEAAASLGADQLVAIDDDAAIADLPPLNAIADLPPLNAIADAVDGATAEKLIAKVKAGGVFGSVLGSPKNAKDFPAVKVVEVYANPDAKTLAQMALAVVSGKLKIPIAKKFPLKEAAAAHAAAEHGAAGKVLIVVS
jgi:NADPH:quinone reductase-like Zn-dependent oxidoreductase